MGFGLGLGVIRNAGVGVAVSAEVLGSGMITTAGGSGLAVGSGVAEAVGVAEADEVGVTAA